MKSKLSPKFLNYWLKNHINYLLCDKIIVINNRVKQLLIDYHKIREYKFKVIDNCANTELFKPIDKNKCREELNIERKYFLVGFVGTLFYYHPSGYSK